MRSKSAAILAVSGWFAVLTGCGAGSLGADAGVTTTTSFQRDIQPLVERSCTSCHQTGGIAPFALDSFDAVKSMGPTALDAITSGRMPPFFASADCNSYEGDFRLSTDEKALFKKWVDEGMPKGADAEAKHAEVTPPPSIRRDKTMAFDGDYDVRVEGKTDNYRCYVLNPENSGDTLVSGYEFLSGNRPLVHHMLAYAIAPADVPQLEALDAADPGIGYACSNGGIGIAKAVQNEVAGWVPGGVATRMPPGTGLMLKAGSRIVMQLHYNTAALYNGGSPTDHSQLALEFAPVRSLTTAQILPMLKYNLDIKANDAHSVQVGEIPAKFFAGSTGTIYRAMGHMHKLGTSVRTDIVHTDGTSQCLLDVQGWDFNWQRDYTLKNPITLRAGDTLRITCTYDNSAPNQAYLNGVQQQPRDVTWGESSFDEMCMTYMTFTKSN